MLPKSSVREPSKIQKLNVYITVEIIEYIPNSGVIKTILRKSTGNISVMSFDSVEGLTEKKTPFNTYIQLIDGEAEIIIDGKNQLLKTGDAIVIPAHLGNTIQPNSHFKLIQTIIKSGYDQL